MGSRLALGIATGVVLGLLTSLSPVFAIVAIVALLVGTVIAVGRHREPASTIQLAGALLGAGAVLLYGTYNTVAACIDTADFCGNANVWPLGAFAVVTVGVGVAAGVIAVRTAR